MTTKENGHTLVPVNGAEEHGFFTFYLLDQEMIAPPVNNRVHQDVHNSFVFSIFL
jgi:hypothetical protein